MAQGLEGIKDQRHGNRGAPTLLSDADLLLFAQSIRADVAEGGVWNGNRVQEWVKTTLQKDLYLSRCYELLDVVGYSPIPNTGKLRPTNRSSAYCGHLLDHQRKLEV